MTNLQKEETKKAINEYCRIKGLSKNELATQINVSNATLSKIENDKWDAIDDKLWRKIHNKLSQSDSQLLFKTTDYSTCFEVCEIAQKNQLIIGLTGDTGMGKTTAVKEYSLRKHVFYVPYDKTMAPKHFFSALLKEMSIAFVGNIHEMVNKIAEEINQLLNPLIIIDEAGKITHTMILYLHVLRDKTIKNCGIVLSGMPYFKRNMLKMSHKQKEGYAEFYRRINLWQELEGLSRSEIDYICRNYGITNNEEVKNFRQFKRFGDLVNEILLYQIQNNNL